MGRSTSSCFKIITCGSDSIDNDDLQRTESKGSTDKRGWSFGKRSTRHRVLSNSITAESPSSGDKESPESTAIDFHTQPNHTVPEKISAPQLISETPQLSTSEDSKLSDPLTASENASKIDPDLEESLAIIIQASIRGYLAQRALLKLKNVVKLQAIVRGHLVRRQAVGTLRCVQAIVKMQALVRARRTHLLVKGSIIEDELLGENGRTNQNVKPLGKENSGTIANSSYISTEKLLSSGFARQLLESTPKKKQIHIKCDPLRPNSAWKWLERWMAVSSTDPAQPYKSEISPGYQEQGEKMENTASSYQEQEEKTENTVSEIGTEILAEAISDSSDLESNTRDTAIPLEVEDNLISCNEESFDFQASHPVSSSTGDDMKQPRLENVRLDEAQETLSKIDSLPNQEGMQLDATSQKLLDSDSDKPEIGNGEVKRTMKRVASEQLETEGKKFVFGSRKASNPAFIAVQSKFEELGSISSDRSGSSTYQDVEGESKLDILLSPPDSVAKASEHSPSENLISHDPRVQVGGSECGTELSISSTFDSPNRSEVGGREFEVESKVAQKEVCDLNGTTDSASNPESLAVEAKNVTFTPLPNSSYPLSVQPGNLADGNGKSVDSVVAVDSPQVEQQPERSASDVQIQPDSVLDRQTYRSSPEGSPRSHITAPESHGTPSSQISVKDKRNKLDKRGTTQNRKSWSADKKSPASLNRDSGARSSMEQLPKESKSAKRRNSFGSVRPDHVDQEPRDSNSTSLPSYMQATESARAKAHANNSPRSSPDVQDKEIYIKKRHSLPGANGKQVSPRIQRSTSQAQSGAKENGTHSIHERKWQR